MNGIAGVFDRAADTYDAVGVPWFGPIAAGLVEELAVRPGESVLDIGCGRGAALVPLARAAGPGGRVLGVDLAPRMVELTAADVRDLPWVRVQVADAAAIGLEPSSFNVVASCLVVFFLSDPQSALRDWCRLLTPDGRMGITTFGPQDDRWVALDSVFLPYLPPAMLDARTSGRRGPFASDEGVASLLSAAGLCDVRTTHRVVEAVFNDAEHLIEFTWSHGQRAMWEAVPQDQRAVVREQMLTQAQRLHDAGDLRFRQEVRHTLGRRC